MNIYKLLLLLVIGFSSCESQILDLDSLTEPVDDIYLKKFILHSFLTIQTCRLLTSIRQYQTFEPF